jgi:DNA-binding HxlR family transcriptional regulator
VPVKLGAMAGKRTYGDPCGVARALDVIGERWGLLVVRELLLGPKRFTDLRAGLPHVAPDVLSQRLRELEQGGVVRRGKLAPPAGSRIYELTDWGRELEPVMLGLGRWGTRAPFPPGETELGIDSLILALKTLFDVARADGISGRTFELRLGDQRFAVRVGEWQLDVSRRAVDSPDAVIAAAPGTLERVLWHELRIEDAVGSGELSVAGDRRAAERFLTLFPLPQRPG